MNETTLIKTNHCYFVQYWENPHGADTPLDYVLSRRAFASEKSARMFMENIAKRDEPFSTSFFSL